MAEEEALGEVDVGGRIDGRKADVVRTWKILLTPVSGGVQSPVPVLPKLVIFAKPRPTLNSDIEQYIKPF